MTLVKCETCDKQYSIEAAKCPNCHARNPQYENILNKILGHLKKLFKYIILLTLLLISLTIAYSAYEIVKDDHSVQSENQISESENVKSALQDTNVPECNNNELHDNLEQVFQQQNPNTKILEIYSNYEINYDAETKTRSCLAHLTLTNAEGSFLYTFSESRSEKGQYLVKIQPVTFDVSEYVPKKMDEYSKSILLGEWTEQNDDISQSNQIPAKILINEKYTTFNVPNGNKLVCRILESSVRLKVGFCFKNGKFKSDCLGSKSNLNIPGSEYWETNPETDCPALEIYSYKFDKEKITSSTNEHIYVRHPLPTLPAQSPNADNQKSTMQRQFELGRTLENEACGKFSVITLPENSENIDTGKVKEAVRLYEAAAEAGYSDAQFRLGRCYVFGIGVPQNELIGAKWIQTSLESGTDADGEKSLILATLLFNPKHTEIENSEAFALLKKSIAKDNITAAKVLSLYLEEYNQKYPTEMQQMLEKHPDELKSISHDKNASSNGNDSGTSSFEEKNNPNINCEDYRDTPEGSIRGKACKQLDGTYKLIPN